MSDIAGLTFPMEGDEDYEAIGGSLADPYQIIEASKVDPASSASQSMPMIVVSKAPKAGSEFLKSLDNFMTKTGLNIKNVVAINGPAVLKQLTTFSKPNELQKLIYSYNEYKDLKNLLVLQLQFISFFQHLYFLARLTKSPNTPRLTEPFSKRFLSIQSKIQKEPDTKVSLFGVPTTIIAQFNTFMQGALNIPPNRNVLQDHISILKKTPKEILYYFKADRDQQTPNVKNTPRSAITEEQMLEASLESREGMDDVFLNRMFIPSAFLSTAQAQALKTQFKQSGRMPNTNPSNDIEKVAMDARARELDIEAHIAANLAAKGRSITPTEEELAALAEDLEEDTRRDPYVKSILDYIASQVKEGQRLRTIAQQKDEESHIIGNEWTKAIDDLKQIIEKPVILNPLENQKEIAFRENVVNKLAAKADTASKAAADAWLLANTQDKVIQEVEKASDLGISLEELQNVAAAVAASEPIPHIDRSNTAYTIALKAGERAAQHAEAQGKSHTLILADAIVAATESAENSKKLSSKAIANVAVEAGLSAWKNFPMRGGGEQTSLDDLLKQEQSITTEVLQYVAEKEKIDKDYPTRLKQTKIARAKYQTLVEEEANYYVEYTKGEKQVKGTTEQEKTNNKVKLEELKESINKANTQQTANKAKLMLNNQKRRELTFNIEAAEKKLDGIKALIVDKSQSLDTNTNDGQRPSIPPQSPPSPTPPSPPRPPPVQTPQNKEARKKTRRNYIAQKQGTQTIKTGFNKSVSQTNRQTLKTKTAKNSLHQQKYGKAPLYIKKLPTKLSKKNVTNAEYKQYMNFINAQKIKRTNSPNPFFFRGTPEEARKRATEEENKPINEQNNAIRNLLAQQEPHKAAARKHFAEWNRMAEERRKEQNLPSAVQPATPTKPPRPTPPKKNPDGLPGFYDAGIPDEEANNLIRQLRAKGYQI